MKSIEDILKREWKKVSKASDVNRAFERQAQAIRKEIWDCFEEIMLENYRNVNYEQDNFDAGAIEALTLAHRVMCVYLYGE